MAERNQWLKNVLDEIINKMSSFADMMDNRANRRAEETKKQQEEEIRREFRSRSSGRRAIEISDCIFLSDNTQLTYCGMSRDSFYIDVTQLSLFGDRQHRYAYPASTKEIKIAGIRKHCRVFSVTPEEIELETYIPTGEEK